MAGPRAPITPADPGMGPAGAWTSSSLRQRIDSIAGLVASLEPDCGEAFHQLKWMVRPMIPFSLQRAVIEELSLLHDWPPCANPSLAPARQEERNAEQGQGAESLQRAHGETGEFMGQS